MAMLILHSKGQIFEVRRSSALHGGNAAIMLPQRIAALLKADPDLEALLIEDGPGPGTHEIVRQGNLTHVRELGSPDYDWARLVREAVQSVEVPRVGQVIKMQTVPVQGTVLRRSKTITIFTPFAHAWALPYWLTCFDALRLPEDYDIELLWYDNMADAQASNMLHAYMRGNPLRFNAITYHQEELPTTLNLGSEDVAKRMVAIYGDFLVPRLTTDLVFLLESDVLIQEDALVACLEALDADTAATGCVVWERLQRCPMLWRFTLSKTFNAEWCGQDVSNVDAVSFSATLFRSDDFCAHGFRSKPDFKSNWIGADLALMYDLWIAGRKVKAITSITCPHMLDITTTIPASVLPAPYEDDSRPAPKVASKPKALPGGLVFVDTPAQPARSTTDVVEHEDGTVTAELLLFIPVGDPQFLPDVLEGINIARVGLTVHTVIINNSGGPFSHTVMDRLANIGSCTLIIDDRPRMVEAGYEVPIRVASFWREYLQRKLDAPWIWVVEADVIPPKGFLPMALANIEANEGVSAVGAAMYDRHLQHSLCWRYSNVETANLAFCPPEKRVEEVDGLTYSCTLFRRDALRSIPPIQWRIITREGFLTGADMYMCHQLKLKGWRMIVLGDMPGIHRRTDGTGITGWGEEVEA